MGVHSFRLTSRPSIQQHGMHLRSHTCFMHMHARLPDGRHGSTPHASLCPLSPGFPFGLWHSRPFVWQVQQCLASTLLFCKYLIGFDAAALFFGKYSNVQQVPFCLASTYGLWRSCPFAWQEQRCLASTLLFSKYSWALAQPPFCLASTAMSTSPGPTHLPTLPPFPTAAPHLVHTCASPLPSLLLLPLTTTYILHHVQRAHKAWPCPQPGALADVARTRSLV